MEHNPYQTPVARVEEVSEQAEQRLYVVAPGKFLLLMIGTLTTYSLYWFYRNWSLLNRRHKQYWPVPRAIFSVFFTHSLFQEVDAAIRQRGAVHAWSASLWANLYIVSAIASYVLGRLSDKEIGSPITDIASIALAVPIVWSLYVAQRAITWLKVILPVDHSRSTVANVLWLVLSHSSGCWWLWAVRLFNPESVRLAEAAALRTCGAAAGDHSSPCSCARCGDTPS